MLRARRSGAVLIWEVRMPNGFPEARSVPREPRGLHRAQCRYNALSCTAVAAEHFASTGLFGCKTAKALPEQDSVGRPAAGGQGAARALAHADLPDRVALRRHRGAVRHRWTDQLIELFRLSRADPGHYGQSR